MRHSFFVAVTVVFWGCSDVLVGGFSPGNDQEGGGGAADRDSDTRGDGDSAGSFDTDSEDDSDVMIEACDVVDTYDLLGQVCYVDSVDGDDANSGLTPEAPFRTQSAIGPTCVVARFKRGSRFDEKLRLLQNVDVYTNYGDLSDPQPQFVVPAEPMSGPVIQSLAYPDITIDGLYIAGARGNGTIENLTNGGCVFLGAGSKVLNCEITDCEIGAMLAGQGSLFQGNYVHDLLIAVTADPDVDPNMTGGAQGVFITASDIEVAYNTFVNCQGPLDGQNGDCDGGATEVAAPACETIADVRIHHNFSYNNCGFLSVGTAPGDCKGELVDSEIYQNVSIDSAWVGFLQVNNTDFQNIHYYNNTVVQRAESPNAGLLWVIFTGTSSGMTGGEILPGTVFLTNNLFVFDDVTVIGDPLDAAFEQTTNLVFAGGEDPGFVNISGSSASDFDLTDSSPAVNAGTVVSGNTLDFVNRTITDPSGRADIGAFEIGSPQGDCLPSRSPVN